MNIYLVEELGRMRHEERLRKAATRRALAAARRGSAGDGTGKRSGQVWLAHALPVRVARVLHAIRAARGGQAVAMGARDVSHAGAECPTCP